MTHEDIPHEKTLDELHEGTSHEDISHDQLTIEILVCKGFSGEIVRARINLNDMVEEALPLIADQISYYTPDYEKIGLYNMTADFEYTMQDRFCDRGTQQGDLLFMADGAGCHKE
jgi:hypothetical protein